MVFHQSTFLEMPSSSRLEIKMSVNIDIAISMVEISQAKTFDDAWNILIKAAEKLELNLGSYGFGCMMNWDFSDDEAPKLRPSAEMIIINNYTDEYSDFYNNGNYADYDTTIAWALNHERPALWSEVDQMLIDRSLRGKYSELYHETRNFGMKTGAVIPLRKAHTLGVGGMVFYTDPELSDTQGDKLLIEQTENMKVLSEAFHLHRTVSEKSQAQFHLSQREKDCLQYLCHGHGTKQIAFLLGTHETTVQKQIASAKKKLSARTMTQAVVKALTLELIEPAL